MQMVGQMKGGIKDIEVESSSDEEEEEEEEVTEQQPKQAKSSAKGGMFSIFKGLVGSKNLTQEGMQPTLDKMKDHLIAKNVAADIAAKLCDSVAAKLEGKVLGTFDSIASTVKATLTESLVQILSPKRRVDILRDCIEAKKSSRPYVMTFCGVSVFHTFIISNIHTDIMRILHELKVCPKFSSNRGSPNTYERLHIIYQVVPNEY